MKKTSLAAIFSLALVLGLGSCNNNPQSSSNTSNNNDSSSQSSEDIGSSSTIQDVVDYKTGDTIYESRIVYDKSVDPYNVSIRLPQNKAVASVSSGRVSSEDGQIGVRNGILTISGEVLSKMGTGDREINIVYTDNSTDVIDAIIATKVIKTAEEFQAINDNLKGIYVLGNDIDLKSISNFEPLGRYYTETSTKNDFFHGILDGNGYTISNAKVYYAGSTTSSEDVYNGDSLFEEECHQQGNNIGLFQIIGSSGVVRNTRFDNIRVRGRSIVGVIAGNNSGVIENCLVTETCKVQMGTHFYDNDCNAGGVVGIVAAGARVSNVISLTTSISLPNEFTDFSEDYIGKIGNGWDHPNTVTNDAWWKYANVDRPAMDYSSGEAVDKGSKEIDSNGTQSNGLYAFAGKTWGLIEDSYAIKFTNYPYQGTARDINFSQTHLTSVKPASGNTDLGDIIDSDVKTMDELKTASLYAAFDTDIWTIIEGYVPSINCPMIATTIAE